jgi:outer membrane protein
MRMILPLLLVAVPTLAGAQPLALSIEEALRLAEKSSEEVELSRSALVRAQGQKLGAYSEFLPQVNGTVIYDRALASEYEDAFSGGSGFDFGNLPFGQENTWRLNLSVQQNLFAGGSSWARWRWVRAQRESAEIGLSSARANAVLSAAQVYFDALLADQLLLIAEATLKQAEDTLAQTKLGREAGSQSEFDLLRAQVTRDNQRPLVVQRKVQRDLAVLRLKQQLDLPADRDLELTSSLDDADLERVARVGSEIVGVSESSTRAPLRQAALGVTDAEARADAASAQHLPQLSANMQYGRVAYPDSIFPVWDDFRTNWTVGLVLSVPIFSGLRVRGEEKIAEADVIMARTRLKQSEEQTRLDTANANEQLEAARSVYEASAGTVEQASRAHQIAELRYNQGISTQLELTDARLQLQQARANRAQAARDLQVARMRIALLSELPLSAAVP